MATKRPDKGPTNRQLSVGEAVRKALTEMLGRDELRDPLLEKAVISVTEVRMANDLKMATAYITVLGQSDVEPYVEALERNARFIRGRLTPALRSMKHMPEVRFRKDTSFDNYARIDALLRSPEVVKDLQRDDEEDEAR